MIVRMSKVEIIGPKELLIEVLTLIRGMAAFQVESDMRGFGNKGYERELRPLLLSKEARSEGIYYENLRQKINELGAFLPHLPEVRKSYLEPGSAITAVAALIDRHTAICRELCRKRDVLR